MTEASKFYCPQHLFPYMQAVLQGEYDPGPFFDWSKVNTVLDIGGCVGAFAIWAHVQAPNASIISYEPNPKAAALFRKNAPFAELYEVGVTCGEVEDETLYIPEGNIGAASFIRETVVGLVTHSEVVAKTRLPSYLPPCDFLKIDCEGGEYGILSEYILAMRRIGGRMPAAVAMEYHGPVEARNCAQLLALAGYVPVKAERILPRVGTIVYELF